jgi:hypothetical protein
MRQLIAIAMVAVSVLLLCLSLAATNSGVVSYR